MKKFIRTMMLFSSFFLISQNCWSGDAPTTPKKYFDMHIELTRAGEKVFAPEVVVENDRDARFMKELTPGGRQVRLDYKPIFYTTNNGIDAVSFRGQLFERDNSSQKWTLSKEFSIDAKLEGDAAELSTSDSESTLFSFSVRFSSISIEEIHKRYPKVDLSQVKTCPDPDQVSFSNESPSNSLKGGVKPQSSCTAYCSGSGGFRCCGGISCCDCGSCCSPP